MTIDGEDQTLKQGDVLDMTVGARHTFAARGGSALLLEVSKPCIEQDSFFEDGNINVF